LSDLFACVTDLLVLTLPFYYSICILAVLLCSHRTASTRELYNNIECKRNLTVQCTRSQELSSQFMCYHHQSTQFTLYIYIKVLLVLAGYVGGDAGVAARVGHLGLLDLHHPTVGRDGDVVVRPQDLAEKHH